MKSFISIFKPRIVIFLVLISLLSLMISSNGVVNLNSILLLAVSGSLSSSGASALNNYFDRDIDRLMKRTLSRPIPSSMIRADAVLYSGILMILIGSLIGFILTPLTSLFIILGSVFYVLVYTLLLKRKTWMNIIIGGFAGSCAVLAGFYAGYASIQPMGILLAFLVFLWTPSHFWSFSIAYRDDYIHAGIPMLPAINFDAGKKAVFFNDLVLIIAGIYLSIMFGGIISILTSTVLGMVLMLLGYLLLKSDRFAFPHYRFTGIYLLGIFLSLLLDTFNLS